MKDGKLGKSSMATRSLTWRSVQRTSPTRLSFSLSSRFRLSLSSDFYYVQVRRDHYPLGTVMFGNQVYFNAYTRAVRPGREKAWPIHICMYVYLPAHDPSQLKSHTLKRCCGIVALDDEIACVARRKDEGKERQSVNTDN